MRLTVYTDYALRVLMYLSLKYGDGEVATIDEIADAYGISRNHLTKIVHELARHGVIETVRGRAGGARLARDPRRISVGEVVRIAEKDFAVVECHDVHSAPSCVIFEACNLKRGLRRAMDAFMHELDSLSLADAIGAPSVAAPLLRIERSAPPGRRTIPIGAPAGCASPARSQAAARKPAPAASRGARKRAPA